MTTIEFILQTIAFGLAFWLGLYLVARDWTDRRLLLAGLGLVAYAAGLALDLLANFAPEAEIVGWVRPFFGLPALCWSLLLWFLLRGQPSWRERLRRQPRPIAVITAATIFFGLGVSFFFFPFDWLPRRWVMLGIGVDLVLLGLVTAVFDAFDAGESLLPHFLRAFDYSLLTALLFGGQVALVMALSTGITFPMLLLLLTTIAASIIMQTFANPLQSILDRWAFTPFPQVQQTRAALRAVDDAVQRVDGRLNLSELEETDFLRFTRRALSHMGNLPRLAANPLTRLPLIEARLRQKGSSAGTLERAAELKLVLTESICRLKPNAQEEFGTTDEWRHYNALYFPYVVGLKPYSRQANRGEMDTAVRHALDWFRAEVPQRTLYNWQNAAAKLVAQDLREQSRRLAQAN